VLKPRAFVLENVPAMASGTLPGQEQTVPTWLRGRMALAGYRLTDPTVLNASHYGVPQHRRRLMLVVVRGGIDVLRVDGDRDLQARVAALIESVAPGPVRSRPQPLGAVHAVVDEVDDRRHQLDVLDEHPDEEALCRQRNDAQAIGLLVRRSWLLGFVHEILRSRSGCPERGDGARFASRQRRDQAVDSSFERTEQHGPRGSVHRGPSLVQRRVVRLPASRSGLHDHRLG
jgi:site-specific DNA-cytosine methylase